MWIQKKLAYNYEDTLHLMLKEHEYEKCGASMNNVHVILMKSGMKNNICYWPLKSNDKYKIQLNIKYNTMM